jgi:ABC-type phosphonate transport system ATPase subunit
MLRRCARAAALVVPVVLVGGLVGCGSGKSTSASAIRGDLTPELSTMHQRPADISNEFAHMSNANWRMMRRDFIRGAHWDRPSRLSVTPIPH